MSVCRTSVPRTVVTDSCFHGMSVSLSCTHQGFFVLLTASHQGSLDWVCQGLSLAGMSWSSHYGDTFLCCYVCWIVFVGAAVRCLNGQNFHSALRWSGGERGEHTKAEGARSGVWGIPHSDWAKSTLVQASPTGGPGWNQPCSASQENCTRLCLLKD